jgi:hypothetical protein
MVKIRSRNRDRKEDRKNSRQKGNVMAKGIYEGAGIGEEKTIVEKGIREQGEGR